MLCSTIMLCMSLNCGVCCEVPPGKSSDICGICEVHRFKICPESRDGNDWYFHLMYPYLSTYPDGLPETPSMCRVHCSTFVVEGKSDLWQKFNSHT